MRVLVVGGAGYIGSHTVRELLNQSYKVVVYDSLIKGHKESLPSDIDFIEGCLSDKKKLNEVFSNFDIDAVIQFAGFIEAGESMKDPLLFHQNNVVNGINLLDVMIKNNVKKIIFSSSAGVYGNPEEIPIKENSQKSPVNYYGLTKLMFEQILDSCKVYGMKSICLRYFNAAGAAFGLGEDHNPESHLIPLVLQVALGKREDIKVFGTDYETRDGSCVRDYVHVLDLAKAHVLALEGLEKGKEGKYNIGSERGYSVKEVIEVAREVTGKDIKAVESERRKGDPAILVASSEKFFQEFGWKPEIELKEIISSAWEWHSKNPNGF
jgi:UDP-glucose 4-epimerase